VPDHHGGADLPGDLLGLVAAGVVPERDMRALVGQRPGDGRTDAARGTGDQRDATAQSKIHCHSCSLFMIVMFHVYSAVG
jgi:hypothetical protein